MAVTFHDPRGRSSTPVDAYDRTIDLGAGNVGFAMLANGFPDSVEFLEAVEGVIADHLPDARFRRYNKGNASNPVSDEMLADIVSSSDVVVAAYGH